MPPNSSNWAIFDPEVYIRHTYQNLLRSLHGRISRPKAIHSDYPSDVTGKWIVQMPGRNGTIETVFDFKVEGTKLIGSISNLESKTEISDGKIDGNNISFAVVRKLGETEFKVLWKGIISGDEIKFMREFQLPPAEAVWAALEPA